MCLGNNREVLEIYESLFENFGGFMVIDEVIGSEIKINELKRWGGEGKKGGFDTFWFFALI